MFCIALAGPPTNVIPVSMAAYAKNSVGMETLLPCTVKAAKRYRKNVWFQPIERNDLRVVRFIGTADASSLLGVDWVCTGEVSERWWGRWREWTEHLIALANNGRHELAIGESESSSLVVLCSSCVRPTFTTGFSIFKARKNVMGNVKIKYQVLNVVLARAKLQVSLTV